MAEFYSARGWEIPPLPWTNLSPPFSGGAAYDTRGFFPGNWQNLWKNDLRGATPRRLPMTKLAEGLLDLDDPPINALLVYQPVDEVGTGHKRPGLIL